MTIDWNRFGIEVGTSPPFVRSTPVSLLLPFDFWGDSWNHEDTIELTVEDGVCRPDEIEFVLASRNDSDPVRWWKGLRLVTTGGIQIGMSETQDDQHKGPAMSLNVADIDDKKIELWKAKFLGVHTGMYDLDLSLLAGFGGRRFTFLWLQDNGDGANA